TAHEGGHRNLEPITFLPKQVLLGNWVVAQFEQAGISGRHSKFCRQILFEDSFLVSVNYESANSVPAFRVCESHDCMSNARIRDEIFHSVENVLTSLILIRHLHFEWIAASLGLG